jgi:hypothetical protein
MPYTPTNWVDGVTPVNAANLNKLEQGLAAAVGIPADVVVTPSTAHLIRNRYTAGDTQPSFRLGADGLLQWGAGGASAPDISLYRLTGGVAKLDGALNVNHDWGIWTGGSSPGASAMISHYAPASDANPRIRIDGNGKISWGPGGATAVDANLYRVSAGTLKSDGNLNIRGAFGKSAADVEDLAFATWQDGASQDRFEIYAQGTMYWGDGAVPPDTWLARGAAHQLVTENLMMSDGTLDINTKTSAANLILGTWLDTEAAYRFKIDGNGKMDWGPGGAAAADANLYRVGAGILKTDGYFQAGKSIFSLMGESNGTAFYADYLASNGYAFIAKQAADSGGYRIMIAANGSILFGSGAAVADHSLYRYDANGMAFSRSLRVAGGFVVDNDSTGNSLYWGSALDVHIYRSAAGMLRLQGHMSSSGEIDPDQGRIGKVCKTITDWDAALDNGWYMGGGGTLNGPAALTGWTQGEVIAHGAAGWRIQRVWDFTTTADSQVFERRQLNGTWSAWVKVGFYQQSPGFIGTDSTVDLFRGSGAPALRAWWAKGDTYPGFQLDRNGDMAWGPGGAVGPDVNLVRSAASVLKASAHFVAGGQVGSMDGAVGQIRLTTNTGLSTGAPTIFFGNALDTNLYRAAAGVLKTDGQIEVGATGVKFSDGSVQTKAAAGTMVLIAEHVLGAAGWLEVASIPGTYRHLRVEIVAKSNTGGDGDKASIRFNGVGSGYYNRGNVTDSDITDRGYFAWVTGNSGSAANEWGVSVIEIPYYSMTGMKKHLLSRFIARCGFSGSGNDVRHGVQGAECLDFTDAITQIQAFSDGGSANGFVAGSKMSVYGIV